MIHNSTDIAILLATYNSEKYLREQIDSIFAQTFQNWTIYIHDDGSRDSTIDIYNEYHALYPDKIILIEENKLRLGAYKSFMLLLQAVDSAYYMFCDHDDVWLEDKIQKSYSLMMQKTDCNINMPIVIHTDMYVTDSEMNIISDSFWKTMKLIPNSVSYLDLVLCNSVNGCTMLFNQLAKEVSMKNINFCTMHDMLVARSVAAVDGIISHVNIPLVMYRQHENNVVGAYKIGYSYYWDRIKKPFSILKGMHDTWRVSNNIKKTSWGLFVLKKIEIIIKRYMI